MRSALLVVASALAALLSPPVRAASPVVLVLAGPADRPNATAFEEAASFAITMRQTVDGEASVAGLVEGLAGHEFSLVYAVGDLAMSVAVQSFDGVPIVYTDVSDGFPGADTEGRVGGSSRTDPLLAIPKLRQALPGLRRLAAVRTASDSDAYWSRLEVACESAGVDLEVSTVDGRDRVEAALQGLSRGVDAFWLQPDPSLWTDQSVEGLFAQAWGMGLPVIGHATSQLHGEHPAAVVVERAGEDLGRAAASLAHQILIEGVPAGVLEFPLIQVQLLGNPTVMRKQGLSVGGAGYNTFDHLVGGEPTWVR